MPKSQSCCLTRDPFELAVHISGNTCFKHAGLFRSIPCSSFWFSCFAKVASCVPSHRFDALFHRIQMKFKSVSYNAEMNSPQAVTRYQSIELRICLRLSDLHLYNGRTSPCVGLQLTHLLQFSKQLFLWFHINVWFHINHINVLAYVCRCCRIFLIFWIELILSFSIGCFDSNVEVTLPCSCPLECLPPPATQAAVETTSNQELKAFD